MSEIWVFGLIVAGVFIGAGLTWFLSRGKAAAQIEAAVARTESLTQAELGLARERARVSDAAVEALQAQATRSDQEFHQIQEALSKALGEVATLRERAAALPALQTESEKLTERIRSDADEIRKLSSGLSEKTESTRLLAERVNALGAESQVLEAQVNDVALLLQAANERRASLEEQVTHMTRVTLNLNQVKERSDELATELSQLRETSSGEIGRLGAELAAERDAHELVKTAVQIANVERAKVEKELQSVTAELTEVRTRADAEAKSAAEKLATLDDAKLKLSDAFRTLANDILEEKSKRFAEQNQTALGQMLDPLRLQLNDFKGKVEEVYVQESKDRSALSEQVRQLFAMNQTISDDAKRLTKALKGEAKTQGNWGELILERVLEASGLRKGYEYVVQDSQVREDGSRAQPDVVIHLPEERRIVVDAKVSLLAYDELVRAETDESRAIALRRHLESVRSHIKGLSDKKYQALYGLQSLDFVLMFVPVEPAFMTAVTGDENLFMDAWERNVLLVSPSTLLFVVRTVAHLWRQEAQSRNAQDIAKRGAELYDRLSDFVKDLESVGMRLRQAQDSYDSAAKRLSQGRGNVIRQAELLKELGVKATKDMPSKTLASMQESLDAEKIHFDAPVPIQLIPEASDDTTVPVATLAQPAMPQ